MMPTRLSHHPAILSARTLISGGKFDGSLLSQVSRIPRSQEPRRSHPQKRSPRNARQLHRLRCLRLPHRQVLRITPNIALHTCRDNQSFAQSRRTLISSSVALRITQSGDSTPCCVHPHPRSFMFTPCNSSPLLPPASFHYRAPVPSLRTEHTPIQSFGTLLFCHPKRPFLVTPNAPTLSFRNTVRNLKALTTTALASPQRS